jgi:tripartite motif-containing protein 71
MDEIGVVIFGSHGDGPGEFNDPAGIVVDPNGYLFVVDSLNNRIPGVCYIQISCCVIQCNAKGIIEFTWALSNLAPLTNKGSFVTEWGTSGNKNGQLSSPIGIDEDDAKQNVYVTDLGNNRVQRFTNNGIFVSTWGMIGSEAGQFNNPGRIAVDPSGNLFVADLGKSRIQKFDANEN